MNFAPTLLADAPPVETNAAKPTSPKPPTNQTGMGTDDGDNEYEAVTGIDRKTVELKRVHEAQVERKVSQDHAALIWAYGVFWALFAIYAVTLWRRSVRLSDDLAALKRELDK